MESRIENFKNRIANKQVDVIEYVDSYSKVTLKCHVCGNTFSKSYNAMLKHSECPHCNPSTTPKVERNPKSPKISAEEQQLNRSLKYFDKLSVNSAGKVCVLAYNGAKEMEDL